MDGNLDTLIKRIAQHYQFDESSYPETKSLTEEKRRSFGIRHLSQHFAKTAGKIAAETEPVDHGEAVNKNEIKINLAKVTHQHLTTCRTCRDDRKRVYGLYK